MPSSDPTASPSSPRLARRPQRPPHAGEDAEHEEEAADEVQARGRGARGGGAESEPDRSGEGGDDDDRAAEEEDDPSRCSPHVIRRGCGLAGRLDRLRGRGLRRDVHRPALERVVASDQVVVADRASGGVSTSQCPSWKRGQRGWKLQAAGGLIGFGTSPSSTTCLRARPASGLGSGTAFSSAPV